VKYAKFNPFEPRFLFTNVNSHLSVEIPPPTNATSKALGYYAEVFFSILGVSLAIAQ
jgi:hypothetical protein